MISRHLYNEPTCQVIIQTSTPFKNMFLVMWLLWLVEMSWHHIQKFFPGLLHTPIKYEENPLYGCKAIAKRKCGSGGVASPIYKQASLMGRLTRPFTQKDTRQYTWLGVRVLYLKEILWKSKAIEIRSLWQRRDIKDFHLSFYTCCPSHVRVLASIGFSTFFLLSLGIQ